MPADAFRVGALHIWVALREIDDDDPTLSKAGEDVGLERGASRRRVKLLQAAQRFRHRLELSAVRGGDRCRSADGLCADGRDLADHEDRRPAAGTRRPVGPHRMAADGRRARRSSPAC